MTVRPAERKPDQVAESSSVTGEIQRSIARIARVCWPSGPGGAAETPTVQGGVSATQSAIRGGFGNESGGFGNPAGVSVRGLNRGCAHRVLASVVPREVHDPPGDGAKVASARGGRIGLAGQFDLVGRLTDVRDSINEGSVRPQFTGVASAPPRFGARISGWAAGHRISSDGRHPRSGGRQRLCRDVRARARAAIRCRSAARSTGRCVRPGLRPSAAGRPPHAET